MTRFVSPNAAVQRTGVSRSSIMRALADKTLVATRDNRNRWLIDIDDLDAWAANRPEQSRTVKEIGQDTDQINGRTVADTSEIKVLRDELKAKSDALYEARIELAKAETTADHLTKQLDELRTDRDRWHQLATAPKPSLMDRIRGTFRKS